MVQSEIRAKLLYLGMQIDIQDEGAVLDMWFYAKIWKKTRYQEITTS
jgi:hypothetical protein